MTTRILKLAPILIAIAGLALAPRLSAATSDAAKQAAFKLGTAYHRVVPVQPTRVWSGQVRVIAFFAYDCAHCYTLEPYIKRWRTRQNANIQFKRVPVLTSAARKLQARAFYTAKQLGVFDSLDDALFRQLHQHPGRFQSENDFAQLFSRHGIDTQRFKRVWESSEIDAKLQQAGVLATRYRLQSIPSVAVGGRYMTRPGMASDATQFFSIIDFLIQKTLESQR